MVCNYSYRLVTWLALYLSLFNIIPCAAAESDSSGGITITASSNTPLNSSMGFEAPRISADDDDDEVIAGSAPATLSRSWSGLGAALATPPSSSGGMSPGMYCPFTKHTQFNIKHACLNAIQNNDPDALRPFLQNVYPDALDELIVAQCALVDTIAQKSLCPSHPAHTNATRILSMILEKTPKPQRGQ